MIKPGSAATLVPIVRLARAVSGGRECGHACRVRAVEVLGIDGAEGISSAGGGIGERTAGLGLEGARVHAAVADHVERQAGIDQIKNQRMRYSRGWRENHASSAADTIGAGKGE